MFLCSVIRISLTQIILFDCIKKCPHLPACNSKKARIVVVFFYELCLFQTVSDSFAI